MIPETALFNDLSINKSVEWARMSDAEKLDHRIRLIYGERFTVGGIMIRASVEAVEQFKNVHPDLYEDMVNQALIELGDTGTRIIAQDTHVDNDIEPVFVLEQPQVGDPLQRQSERVAA